MKPVTIAMWLTVLNVSLTVVHAVWIFQAVEVGLYVRLVWSLIGLVIILISGFAGFWAIESKGVWLPSSEIPLAFLSLSVLLVSGAILLNLPLIVLGFILVLMVVSSVAFFCSLVYQTA